MCSTTIEAHGYFMPTGLSAACAPCSCALTGATCAVPTVSVWVDPTCTDLDAGASSHDGGNLDGGVPCAMGPLGAACSQVPAGNIACVQSGASLDLYVSVTAPTTGGTCASSMEVPVRPAQTWTNVVACADTSTTMCADGICEPSPGAQGVFQICVVHSGDVSCPTPSYPTKMVIYSTITDDRDCTACTCGAPVPAQCSGGAARFSADCSGGGGSADAGAPSDGGVASADAGPPNLDAGKNIADGGVPVPTTCSMTGVSVSNAIFAQLTESPVPPASGTCAVSSGGMPIGAVGGGGSATTICCL